MVINSIAAVLRSKKRQMYSIPKAQKCLEVSIDCPPGGDTVYKLISLSGGFSSINFIKYIADREVIEELTVSTLRIGEKQFMCLKQMTERGTLKKATFCIGSIMKSDGKGKRAKYDYFQRFENYCKKYEWESVLVNNHSKIILMRTAENYYVLETSSNLNENPKIEQYSFENSKELYEFYYSFFETVKAVQNEIHKEAE